MAQLIADMIRLKRVIPLNLSKIKIFIMARHSTLQKFRCRSRFARSVGGVEVLEMGMCGGYSCLDSYR